MKLNKRNNLIYVLTVCLVCFITTGYAQQEFTTEHPFELSLYVDFQRFVDQMDDPSYIPAKISYHLNGVSLTKKVKVKARGAFRRKSCEIPPIRISFNDDDYGVDLFNKLGKVKLVNECHFGQQYQEYLVKEYLTYQTYQKLSDYSLKTWFTHIKFIDSQDTTNHFTSYSFIIEDIDDLAMRVQSIEIEEERLEHSDIDDHSEGLVMLFNYMISNPDLYVENLHNLKLLQLKDSKAKPILVPYDFDFCGLVNADYAFVSDDHPGTTVRDRYYLGECRSKKEYAELYQFFISKKTEIYKLYVDNPLLSEETQIDAIDYLSEFYLIIENSRLANKYIAKKCW